MSPSRTVSSAEERLLDVALEQIFVGVASSSAPARRRSSWVLAAGLLLGLGVTAAMLWDSRSARAVPAQDPGGTTVVDEVEVSSLAEMSTLPASTSQLSLSLVDAGDLAGVARFEGLKSLQVRPKQNAFLGIAVGYHSSWSRPPADLLASLAALAHLEVLSLPRSLVASPGVVAALAESRSLRRLEIMGEGSSLGPVPVADLARIEPLRELSLHMVALDVATLRALAQVPLTSLESKFCSGLDAEGWRQLLKMRTLQRLCFLDWSWDHVPDGSAPAPGWHPEPRDLQGLDTLPDLRALELHHCNVEREQLASLPKRLTALRLTGARLATEGLVGLRRFADLRELTIDTRRSKGSILDVMADDPVPEAEALATVLASLRLRSLEVFGALVPALADAVRAQSELRVLAIHAERLDPDLVATMLAGPKLEILRLRQMSFRPSDPRVSYVPAVSKHRDLRELQLPVRDLEGIAELASLAKLERLVLLFDYKAPAAPIDPAALMPFSRSTCLREITIHAHDSEVPIAVEPLQTAVGRAIRVLVHQ